MLVIDTDPPTYENTTYCAIGRMQNIKPSTIAFLITVEPGKLFKEGPNSAPATIIPNRIDPTNNNNTN